MNTPPKQPILVNAAEMARQYPNEFEAPAPEELTMLKIGDFAKVCILRQSKQQLGIPTTGERFWVQITNIAGPILTGRVDNDLDPACSLQFNDYIQFGLDNIYACRKQ